MSAALTSARAAYPPPEYFASVQRDGFHTAAELLEPAAVIPLLRPDPVNRDVLPVGGTGDTRASAILPAPFGGTRRMRDTTLPLFEIGTSHPPFEPSLLGTLPSAQGSLKGPPWHGVPELRVPTFLVADKGRDDLKVASTGLRLFVELLMLVPRRSRQASYRLQVPLLYLAACLWPNTEYEPKRHGDQLIRALLVAHNCRLPWVGRLPGTDHDIDGYWAAVVVKSEPQTAKRHSEVIIDVDLPPGSHAGPLVYRPTLRKYGAESAMAWRLTLALVWMWDFYLTGPRAPGLAKLPWLDSDELVRLASGRDISRMRKKQTKHRLVLRAQHAVDRLYEDRGTRVQVDRGRLRLLPPADWRQRS